MNRNYKIVFNKARGTLMVVNEVTSSCSGNGRKERVRAPGVPAVQGRAFIKKTVTELVSGVLLMAFGAASAAAAPVVIDAEFDSAKSALTAGSGNTVTGSEATVVGSLNTAGRESVAVGSGTAAGQQTVAIGNGISAAKLDNGEPLKGAVVIGDGSFAGQVGGVSVGTGAHSGQGISAAAFGAGTSAVGTQATAVGYKAHTNNNQATAFGYNASVDGGEQSAAFGTNASSSHDETIAMGDSAKAKVGAVAIGKKAEANANLSVSVGESSVTSGNGAIAFGSQNKASGTGAFVAGTSSTASGKNSFVMGNSSMASGEGAIAIGTLTNVSGFRTVQIGASDGAAGRASAKDGVLFGSGKNIVKSSATVGYDPKNQTHTSDPVWISTSGSVEVNGRQITNVAAGSANSDAINVAQLIRAQFHYYSIGSGTSISTANYNNNLAYHTNSLAAGPAAYVYGTTGTAVGSTVSVAKISSAANSVALGSSVRTEGYRNGSVAAGNSVFVESYVTDGVAFGTGTKSTVNQYADYAVAAGTENTVETFADYAVALGSGNTVKTVNTKPGGTEAQNTFNFGSLALGVGTVTYDNSNAAVGAGSILAGEAGNVSGRQSAFAAGSGSVTAVNYSAALGTGSVQATQQNSDFRPTAALPNNLMGSAAFGTGKIAADNDSAFAAGAGEVSASKASAVAFGSGTVKADGKNSAAVGSGEVTVSGEQAFAAGTGADAVISSALHSVAVGANGVRASAEGAAVFGSDTAEAAALHSAVFGSENMTATGEHSVAMGSGTVSASDANSVAVGSNQLTASAGGAVLGSGNVSSTGGIALGINETHAGAGAIAAGSGVTAAGNSAAMGYGTETSAAGAAAMGKNASASGQNAFAAGTGASVTTEGGVALGSGSSAERGPATQAGYDPLGSAADGSSTWISNASAISVGTADGDRVTRRITGVAAGLQDSDAVNVAQLKVFQTALDSKGKMYFQADDAAETAIMRSPDRTIDPPAHTLNVTGDTVYAADGSVEKAGNVLTVQSTASNANEAIQLKLNDHLTFGTDGADGEDGKLTLHGANKNSVTADASDGLSVKGPAGSGGTSGKDAVKVSSDENGTGTITLNGAAGTKGEAGTSAINIQIANGTDGPDGQKGAAGVDGADGLTRIVYTDGAGPRETASMDDGLKFAGDDASVIAKKLNTQFDLVGGAPKASLTRQDNIGVNNENGALKIQLSSELKALKSISAGDSVDFGGTLNNDGDHENPLSVGSQTAGNNKGGTETGNFVTGLGNTSWNPADPSYVPGRAATEDQLVEVSKEAGKHTAVTVNGGKASVSGTNAFGEYTSEADGNLRLASKDETGKTTYDLKLNDKMAFGTPGEDGTDGEIKVTGSDGSGVTANGKDGISVTAPDGKDGVTVSAGENGEGKLTVNGAPGTNGANGKTSVEITVANGVDGTNGTNGKTGVDGADAITRIVYQDAAGDHQAATLDDGFQFAGDFNPAAGNVPVKLNHQMNLKGGETDEAQLTEGNIGVVAEAGNDGSVKLTMKLKKDVNLTSYGTLIFGDETASAANPDVTSLTKDGLSIADGPVITKDTTDMHGQQIHGVAAGTDPKDAINVSQLRDYVSKNALEALRFSGDNYQADKAETVLSVGKDDRLRLLGDGTTTQAGNITTAVAESEVTEAGEPALKVSLERDLHGINSINAGGSVNFGGAAGPDGKIQNPVTVGNQSVKYTEGDLAGTSAEGNFVTGLDNRTWNMDDPDYVSGRALTEDQLAAFSTQLAAATVHTAVTVNGGMEAPAPGADGAYGNYSGGSLQLSQKVTENGRKTYDLKLNEEVLVGSVGRDGADGGVNVVSKDGSSVSMDGKGGLAVTGPAGADGAPGKDGVVISSDRYGEGSIALNGADGTNGKDGTSVSIHVENGKNGADGQKGEAGVDGRDGITRVTYEDAAGEHQAATMEDGFKFAGDSNPADGYVPVKLNNQVNIVGGADPAKLTEGNIGVVAEATDGGNAVLTVKLNKDLNLSENGSVTVGDTVIDKGGLTIKNGPSVTENGIDAGGKKITNVEAGTSASDLVNVSQLETYVDEHVFDVEAGKNTTVSRTPAQSPSAYSVDVWDTDVKGEGGVSVKATNDETTKMHDFALDLSDQLELGKAGADGVDGQIGLNGKDGTGVAINGTDGIAVHGTDGKNGVTVSTSPDGVGSIGLNGKDGTVSIQVADGTPGLDGKDGDTMTRVVYKDPDGNTHEIATMDDGFKFAADQGGEIGKKLNETLSLNGDGKNITTVSDGEGSIRVQLNDKLTLTEVNVTNSLTVGDNVHITDKGITIEGGPSVTVDGIDAGGDKITNVAAGTAPTDAANVSQLENAGRGFSRRADEVDSDASAGIAQALAAAGLPQAYRPGKNMYAVAGGYFRGEAGYAIGMSSISDNGNWIWKLTGSGNSQNHYGVSVNVGYRW